ncbi:hypothetical protein TNCV_2353831 [Trichonephila clavipes]|nr:hypothetical protein TNCV_2353831 [Trichonephila clavipes]
MLIEINSYIRDFKTTLQSFPPNPNQNDYKIVINADRRPSAEHRGHHNEPTTNEVSVLLQKRGLPHAHILIWLEPKIRAEQIDDVIRAELPDQEVDLELFGVVKTYMVHGPCGSYNPRSPCMKNGICSKRFPKPFCTETVTGEGVYPFYRRRSPENSGIRTAIQYRANCIHIDNRWIVPFSLVLSRILEHISTSNFVVV